MARMLSDIYPTRQVEGYSETHSSSQGSVTEAFLVPWATRISDIRLLLNSTHSDTAAFPDWQCTNVGVTHTGWETDTIPTKALLATTYVDPATGIELGAGEQRVYSDWIENWQSGGEALTIGKGCVWSDTGKPIEKEEVSAVKIFPQVQITMSGKIPGSDFNSNGKSYVLNTIGKTNSAAVSIKGFSYTAESLLFLGTDGSEAIDSATAASSYAITMKFAAMYDHTWNEFWDGSTFRKVLDEAGDPIYASAIFSDINPDKW